jgi:ribonuclease HI
MRVIIYTDGGADPNPGVGGWAAILKAGKHEKVLSGNESWTTNNRMELQAAIAALSALKGTSEVDFHTDSEYVRRGITEWIDTWADSGWKRKGKKIPNDDLWKELWKLNKEHEISWHWVRGHSGNPLNERVDRIARQARISISPAAELPQDIVKIYVRGACKGNPGPGGWGVVVERGDDTEQMSGSERKTTNNRMELQAVIEGLSMVESSVPVQVITTSDYVYQGATRWVHGWRKREWRKKGGGTISNVDLWKLLSKKSEKREIWWASAKGPIKSYDPGVNEAGQLARIALIEFE